MSLTSDRNVVAGAIRGRLSLRVPPTDLAFGMTGNRMCFGTLGVERYPRGGRAQSASSVLFGMQSRQQPVLE